MNLIKKSMQEIFSYQFCIVLLSMGSDLGWAAGSNKLGNCSKICAKTAGLIQKRSHTYFKVWVLRISLVSVTVEKFLRLWSLTYSKEGNWLQIQKCCRIWRQKHAYVLRAFLNLCRSSFVQYRLSETCSCSKILQERSQRSRQHSEIQGQLLNCPSLYRQRNKNLYKVEIWHKGQEVWDFAIRDLPCYREMSFQGGPVLSTPLSAHRKKASTRQHWYFVFSFLHTILQQGLSTSKQIQSELNSTHSHPLHFDQFHADKIGEILSPSAWLVPVLSRDAPVAASPVCPCFAGNALVSESWLTVQMWASVSSHISPWWWVQWHWHSTTTHLC